MIYMDSFSAMSANSASSLVLKTSHVPNVQYFFNGHVEFRGLRDEQNVELLDKGPVVLLIPIEGGDGEHARHRIHIWGH